MSLGTVHILYFCQSCVFALRGIYLKKSLHDRGLFSLVGLASVEVNKLRKCYFFFFFFFKFRQNNWQPAGGSTNSPVWLCWHILNLQQCHTFKLVVKRPRLYMLPTYFDSLAVWMCLLQRTAAYVKYGSYCLCSYCTPPTKDQRGRKRERD